MKKLLLGVLLALGLLSNPALAAPKTVNFELTDIQGKVIHLSDFQGKWVLVNFWAPWCPLCWGEVPLLNDLSRREDFVVIGIGMDYGPDAATARESAQSHNLNFEHIIAGGSRRDANAAFHQIGPVDFYPTSYLYDPNGDIFMFIPGQAKREKLLAAMETWAITQIAAKAKKR